MATVTTACARGLICKLKCIFEHNLKYISEPISSTLDVNWDRSIKHFHSWCVRSPLEFDNFVQIGFCDQGHFVMWLWGQWLFCIFESSLKMRDLDGCGMWAEIGGELWSRDSSWCHLQRQQPSLICTFTLCLSDPQRQRHTQRQRQTQRQIQRRPCAPEHSQF